ncbi:MAG TPA: DUF2252 domain-containing protein [Terriglobales bacterium]|jgi:uncharacterized protein (DUF2252 family)
MAVAVQITHKPPRKRNSGVLRVQEGDLRRSGFDLRIAGEPWERRRVRGKFLRQKTSRESHGEWSTPRNRPDPLHIIAASNAGRQKEFIPLRMGRMAASPFAFLRGSAVVMAWDLSHNPTSGIHVVMDGDAHLNNFGLFGTPQRDIVFDLNDFDEAVVGPWEWDLKRLVASVNVAGRENGLNRKERRAAVMRSVDGYRWNVNRLESMGVMETWYLHAYPGRENVLVHIDAKSAAVFKKAVAKAGQQTNATLLTKSSERGVDGAWRLIEEPPVLTRVNPAAREKVIDALNEYSKTLTRERRYMLGRYHVVDVAHRVVGVGSVGTRAYLALLFGNGDNDPLFLQVKEAISPAHLPYVPPLPNEFAHQGRRVVSGQRALQASSDILLGWTSIDGRPFYVRQMKNMKGSIPVEWLSGESFNFYAWACGAILARAHSRTGDAACIAGYCGNSGVLDEAFATWAESYGDQTEADHAALVKAIKSGRVKAITGI